MVRGMQFEDPVIEGGLKYDPRPEPEDYDFRQVYNDSDNLTFEDMLSSAEGNSYDRSNQASN